MKKIIPIYIMVFVFLSSSSHALVISPQYIPYLVKNVPAVISEVGLTLYPTVVRSAAAGAVVSEVVPVAASAATAARIIACAGFAAELASWALVLAAVGIIFQDGIFKNPDGPVQEAFRPDGSYGGEIEITSITTPNFSGYRMKFFRDYDFARLYMLSIVGNNFGGLGTINTIQYHDGTKWVCCAPEFQAPFPMVGFYHSYDPHKIIAAYPANPQDLEIWKANSSYFDPPTQAPATYSKEQVIEKIKEKVQENPEKYKETIKEALRSPSLNEWSEANYSQNYASPYTSPETTTYPTPATFIYPGILTAPDMQALGSSILHDISPEQKAYLDSLSNTNPANYTETTKNDIKSLSPMDVNVINEPTIKIKTESQWKTDAQSELIKPEIKENEEFTFDWPSISEKFSGQKKDLSFLDTIYNRMKSLAIFDFFRREPDNIIKLDDPSSIIELGFSMPSLGVDCHESIDLADFESFFVILGNLLYTLTFFACISIIFL